MGKSKNTGNLNGLRKILLCDSKNKDRAIILSNMPKEMVEKTAMNILAKANMGHSRVTDTVSAMDMTSEQYVSKMLYYSPEADDVTEMAVGYEEIIYIYGLRSIMDEMAKILDMIASHASDIGMGAGWIDRKSVVLHRGFSKYLVTVEAYDGDVYQGKEG